jgi:aminopeptidase N
VEEAGEYRVFLGSRFDVRRISINGKKQAVRLDTCCIDEFIPESGELQLWQDVQAVRFGLDRSGDHVLDIHYRGEVYDSLQPREGSIVHHGTETSGIISEEGVYLSPMAHWYPDIPGDYGLFSIEVTTPKGMESVTEGKMVSRSSKRRETRTQWDILYPTRDVSLVAGDYIVEEIELNGIQIVGYFYRSEADLAEGYLQASRRYIDHYNNLIGPYPFSKFAVVENFFPTGYGMPSFTLLGKRVIRLPFIVDTSLGHEVVHNWWGNSVYADSRFGNWTEGLAVYFADYRYKEAISDSAAAEFRRQINMDYTSYTENGGDFPLSQFRDPGTPLSRAIGYGKCAMVFHMLRRVVGDNMFYHALRTVYEKYRFSEVSWRDIQAVFERISGRDLSIFFYQWLQRSGAPLICLESASIEAPEKMHTARVTLRQEPVFVIDIPVTFFSHDSEHSFDVQMNSAEKTFSFNLDFEAIAVQIDPDHNVLRKMDPLEMQPTIGRVMADSSGIVVLPSMASPDKRRVFEELAVHIGETTGGVVAEDSAVTVQEFAEGNFILLGDSSENRMFSLAVPPDDIHLGPGAFQVGGKEYGADGHCAFITFTNPRNPGKLICAVVGQSASAVEESGYKLAYYGNFSYVTFLDGKKQQAGMIAAESNPLEIRFQLLEEW